MKRLIILCSLLLSLNLFAQNDSEIDFIKWAKENAHPLPLKTEAPNESFSAIGSAIGDAQFVAISESAHNTREFIWMNARLIKYLVEEKGFNRLVCESGFPESKFVNEYISGASILKRKWRSGINAMYSSWKEFNDLIEWLREHNQKVPIDKRVQFYGLDIAGGYHDLMPAFSIVNDYLKAVDPDYQKGFEAKLLPYLDSIKSNEPRQARNRFIEKLSLEEKYDFELELNLAIRHISKNKESYLKKSTTKEYAFVRQSCISFFYAINYYIESGERGNQDFNRTTGINGREIAMHENFQWVYKQDTTAKIVIINHNVHSKTGSGYLDESWKFFIPFGAYIRQEFGDRYYTIGAVYHRGVFWENWTQNEPPHIVKTKEGGENYMDYVLSKMGMPCFFLDFHSIPHSRPAYHWLFKTINLREHDEPMPIIPNEYDAVIYFDEVSMPTKDN